MSFCVARAGQARVRALTALILLAFIACGLCSSKCECDTPQVRAVLTKFYKATGGPTWKNAGGWTSPDPVCKWRGVVCVGANLTDIDLVNNNLTGTLPPDLANITSIQRLYLSENRLTGPLPPQWSAMKQLVELRLRYNQLNGTLPRNWSGMKSITELDLAKNQLSGPLPPQWCLMSQLRNLMLSFNTLNGTLPAEWNAMTQLVELHLYDDNLSGQTATGVGENVSDE